MEPQTAFDLYLRDHPDANNPSRTQPVVFFAPNTLREGMVDFRPKAVAADAEDPEGYAAHVAPVAPPKGWSVAVSAPTSPSSEPEQGENPVPPTVEKDPNPQTLPITAPVEPMEPPVDQTPPADQVPPATLTPPGQRVTARTSATSARKTTG